MATPPGFSMQNGKGKVCRLTKVLCGLKQYSQAWFERFRAAMVKAGYKQTRADHTLFIKHQAQKTTTLMVYMDDIAVTGNDDVEIAKLKRNLAKEVEIKDLGSLKYFLGIEVSKSKQSIILSQRKYVVDLLKDSGMTGYKPCFTPIKENYRFKENDGVRLIDVGRYQRLVRRLIFQFLNLSRHHLCCECHKPVHACFHLGSLESSISSSQILEGVSKERYAIQEKWTLSSRGIY